MVCRTIGDQTGFDIRSFDWRAFDETHIEVKNTSGPASTPFFMSAAKVEYAKTCTYRYVVYRLYGYSAGSATIQFFEIENGEGCAGVHARKFPSAAEAVIRSLFAVLHAELESLIEIHPRVVLFHLNFCYRVNLPN